jgi:hypothetical protein
MSERDSRSNFNQTTYTPIQAPLIAQAYTEKRFLRHEASGERLHRNGKPSDNSRINEQTAKIKKMEFIFNRRNAFLE